MKLKTFKFSSFIFFLYFSGTMYSQETESRERIIANLLKPYESGLFAYLDSDTSKSINSREEFLSLFSGNSVMVPNDFPTKNNYHKTLEIADYAAFAKILVSPNKEVDVKLNFEEFYLCESISDTIVYVKKYFSIGTDKVEAYLKFKLRYYSYKKNQQLRIYSIEKSDKPPDEDHDKVPDVCDNCLGILGSINYNGCPLKDKDKDGILDDKDNCPDVVGEKKYNGCPDTDKDEVPDDKDKCPTESGKTGLDGCPDKDNDGVKDKDDSCPDEFGSAKSRGCPDADDDGISDNNDRCPYTFGIFRCNGCPDSDNDGVPDGEDKCPFVLGIPELSGCPYPEHTVRNSQTNTNDKKIKILLPTVLTSVGLISVGGSFYFQSQSDKLYSDYKFTYPTANSEDLYNEANKNHHNSVVLRRVGIGIAVIGVTTIGIAILTKKLINRSRYEKYSNINFRLNSENLAFIYKF